MYPCVSLCVVETFADSSINCSAEAPGLVAPRGAGGLLRETAGKRHSVLEGFIAHTLNVILVIRDVE